MDGVWPWRTRMTVVTGGGAGRLVRFVAVEVVLVAICEVST